MLRAQDAQCIPEIFSSAFRFSSGMLFTSARGNKYLHPSSPVSAQPLTKGTESLLQSRLIFIHNIIILKTGYYPPIQR
ncbi:hypothetical protein DSECCO2_621530 [anaerobic digester metagenome]